MCQVFLQLALITVSSTHSLHGDSFFEIVLGWWVDKLLSLREKFGVRVFLGRDVENFVFSKTSNFLKLTSSVCLWHLLRLWPQSFTFCSKIYEPWEIFQTFTWVRYKFDHRNKFYNSVHDTICNVSIYRSWKWVGALFRGGRHCVRS